MDYGQKVVWIFVLFLSALWALVVAAPIHCRGSVVVPQMKLLCGADFMDTFKVPGLVGRFGLVCVSRGSLQPDQAIHESDLLSRHRGSICLVREWVHNEISATEVRRSLRRGQSVKYLLPD